MECWMDLYNFSIEVCKYYWVRLTKQYMGCMVACKNQFYLAMRWWLNSAFFCLLLTVLDIEFDPQPQIEGMGKKLAKQKECKMVHWGKGYRIYHCSVGFNRYQIPKAISFTVKSWTIPRLSGWNTTSKLPLTEECFSPNTYKRRCFCFVVQHMFCLATRQRP